MLRDDEALYWVTIGHYEAIAVGNRLCWISESGALVTHKRKNRQKSSMWKMFPRQRSNNDLLRQVVACEQATGARGGGAGELANRAWHNMHKHDDGDGD